MFKSHELNFDSRYTELCNTSPKLWVWVEAIGLEQRETRIIHRTPQPYPQGEVSEITEQLLARSFPNPFIKHSRWLAARRKMFSDQLPTLHILLARLDRFTQSIEHRLLDSVKHDFQLRLPTKAKIEKSLIGFLEAQAFPEPTWQSHRGKSQTLEDCMNGGKRYGNRFLSRVSLPTQSLE